MNRTDRLYALREELRRAGERGRTADELARRFEVSARTVKRDVSALQAAGFPVWARTGRSGGYVVDAAATLPPVALNAAEVSGLAASIAASRGTPFDAAARAALTKLLAAADATTRARATALSRRIWVDDIGSSVSTDVRRTVERALDERRVLRIDGVEVDPVMLAHTRGRWFVVGRGRDDGRMRWWAMDEIARASLLTAPAADVDVADVGTPPATARTVEDA